MVTATNQTQYNGANISYVIDSRLTEVGYGEPVTLAEMKQYCRVLTGTTEDTLFNDTIIPSARKAIEKFTGLSLVPKTAEVIMICPQQQFEIPFGPVTSAVTFVDIDSDTSNLTVIGFDFPVTRYPYNVVTTATYTCGYAEGECPTELKNAILAQGNFLYENRGDNSDSAEVCQAAQKIAAKYSRKPFFF